VTGKTRAVVAEKVRELERKRDAGTVDATASTGCGPNISTSHTALLDDGYSPASVLRYHRILSRALTVAVQRGHVARNVAALVDPPAQRQSDIATALDLGEAPAVLEAAGHVRNLPAGPSSWPSACASPRRWRCSEGRRPARRHTHRAAQHPPRPGRRAHRRGAQDPAQPAHAGPALSLVAALNQHKAAQLGERMLAGSEWHDEDFVSTQPNGRPIDKKTDYDDCTRLLQAAGVRYVPLHDGRHTAATLLLGENVHPRVVMELLGHSQMRTTMDLYSHVMPALAREAADRMGALLPSTATQTATRDDSNRSSEGTENGLVKWVELRGLEPLTPHCEGSWWRAAAVHLDSFPQARREDRQERTSRNDHERGRLATTVAHGSQCVGYE
jgi:integrase